jgi:phosphatidylglycerophosphate synthase
MVLQCGAVALSLWRLWYYQFDPSRMQWGVEPSDWSTWLLRLVVWGAVIMTIYSGWVYVRRAMDLLRQ